MRTPPATTPGVGACPSANTARTAAVNGSSTEIVTAVGHAGYRRAKNGRRCGEAPRVVVELRVP